MGDAYAILAADRDAAAAAAGGNTSTTLNEPLRKPNRRGGANPNENPVPRLISLQDIIRQETAAAKKPAAKKPAVATGADLLRKQGFKVPREILSMVSDESVEPMLVMQIASDLNRQQNAAFGRHTLPSRPVRKFVRKDFRPRPDLRLQRWLREDKPDEYAFSRLIIAPGVLEYTDEEYERVLSASDDWSKAATDELIRMLNLYHFRWHAVQDNWDADTYGPKTTEDLRERYYDVNNLLEKHRSTLENRQPVFVGYDAEHERRRKEQLEALWNRTPEQVEEERQLRIELKKIEARRREREIKARKIQEQAARLDRQAISTAELARQHHRGRPGTSRKSTVGPQLQQPATPTVHHKGEGGGSASKKASASSHGKGPAGGGTKKSDLKTSKKAGSLSSDGTATVTSSKKGGIVKKGHKTGKLRHSGKGGGGSFDGPPNAKSLMLSAGGGMHDELADFSLPPEMANIRFPDVKTGGNSSMKTLSKVPGLKTKKLDALAAMLEMEMPFLSPNFMLPASSEGTVASYNTLRNALLAVYEHKQVLMNEVYDAAQIVSELRALYTGDPSLEDKINEWTEIVERKLAPTDSASAAAASQQLMQQPRRFMDAIDPEKHYQTQRQRKAAIEQQKMMKSLKQRTSAG